MRIIIALALLLFAIQPGAILAEECPEPGASDRNNCDLWIDTNGDGLPGPDKVVYLSAPVTFDLYMDTKGWEGTGYQFYFTLGPDANNLYFSNKMADIEVDPSFCGANVDTHTIDNGFVFYGDCNDTWVDTVLVAEITLLPIKGTGGSFLPLVVPIVEVETQYYNFCRLDQNNLDPPRYWAYFCEGEITPGTFKIKPAPAKTEDEVRDISWGDLKTRDTVE